MDKPTIFFSHSSSDQDLLRELKDLFLQKTGGSIEVFLSSDGQSIQLGHNWVHRVEEALRRARLMLVFITPSSLRSQWVPFEAGFAYAKGLRVVPVGVLGIDLALVTPPLSLLQGFNIGSRDGLDNLIALVNDVFNHRHAAVFTDAEFDRLLSLGGVTAQAALGKYGAYVDEVHLEINEAQGLRSRADLLLPDIADVAARRNLIFQNDTKGKCINLDGISISSTSNQVPSELHITIDPRVCENVSAFLTDVIQSVRDQGWSGLRVRVDFDDAIGCLTQPHKVSARLLGSSVHLAKQSGYTYNGVPFDFDHFQLWRGRKITEGSVYLSVEVGTDGLQPELLKSIITLLFEREILFVTQFQTPDDI